MPTTCSERMCFVERWLLSLNRLAVSLLKWEISASQSDVFEATAFSRGHPLFLPSLPVILPALVAAGPLGDWRAHFSYCCHYLVGNCCCGSVKHDGHASVSAMGRKLKHVMQLLVWVFLPVWKYEGRKDCLKPVEPPVGCDALWCCQRLRPFAERGNGYYSFMFCTFLAG